MTQTAETFVIIGNFGQGRQTTYPAGDAPALYTEAAAEAVLAGLTAPRSIFDNSTLVWHAKPLAEALDYILPGNRAYAAVRALQEASSR